MTERTCRLDEDQVQSLRQEWWSYCVKGSRVFAAPSWMSVCAHRMCVCVVSMHKHECIHRYLYASLLKTWILTQLTMWTNSCWPRHENCQNADNLKWELCDIKENCHPALYQKPLGNPLKNYLLMWGWRPGRPVLCLSTRPIGPCITKPSLLPNPKASASTLLEGQFPCDYIPDLQRPWWVLW